MTSIDKINEIILYIYVRPNCTIKEISQKLYMSAEVVHKIVYYIFNYIDLIGLEQTIEDDFEEINTSKQYQISTIKWRITDERLAFLPITENNELVTQMVNSINSINNKELIEYGAYLIIDKNNENIYEDCNISTVLNSAIYYYQWIKINYKRNNEQFVYTILPIKITYQLDNGIYYLIAYDKIKDIIALRIDCITYLEGTDTYEEEIDDKEVVDWLNKTWGFESGEAVKVKIKFRNDGSNSIIKAKKVLSNKGQQLYNKRGDYIFEGEIYGINYFKSWLRGFGASVQILTPKPLIKDMQNSNKRLLQNYHKIL